MKTRIAIKIINRISEYQNFDSNYQPYSEGQIQKCLKTLHYPINLRKYLLIGKVPTKYRKCKPIDITLSMHELNINPKNVQEYNSFMENVITRKK